MDNSFILHKDHDEEDEEEKVQTSFLDYNKWPKILCKSFIISMRKIFLRLEVPLSLNQTDFLQA